LALEPARVPRRSRKRARLIQGRSPTTDAAAAAAAAAAVAAASGGLNDS